MQINRPGSCWPCVGRQRFERLCAPHRHSFLTSHWLARQVAQRQRLGLRVDAKSIHDYRHVFVIEFDVRSSADLHQLYTLGVVEV